MHTYLMTIGGLALLVAGAEMLVRGGVSIARALQVSPLLIGLTIVAYGTSTPELITSITAALEDSPGIAVGNIVGTTTANILLVLGLAAIIHPLEINPKGFRRDTIFVVAASLILLGLVLYGSIGRLAGAAMVAGLVVYVIHAVRSERTGPVDDNAPSRAIGENAAAGPQRVWAAAALAIGGLAVIVWGANLLVGGAIQLARDADISETVIGLTVIAVGTSAPELTMAILGSLRRQADIAYGNIVGSHIFNILFILGAAALARPLAIPPQIASLDIWVMLAATAILVFFARTGFRLSRREGIGFVAAYAAYVAYMVSTQAA